MPLLFQVEIAFLHQIPSGRDTHFKLGLKIIKNYRGFVNIFRKVSINSDINPKISRREK